MRKLTTGEKSIFTSVRLTQAQKAALETTARKSGLTPSEIIRRGVTVMTFALGAASAAK